jgi:ribonuclease BN (tRNA processing enzyme)
MKITVLGAGTCIPSKGYSAPGYVLSDQSSTMLVDPGPGSIARLSALGYDYRMLTHVYFSHLHPDHTLDLLTLIQALGATPGWQRGDELVLLGCPGLTDFVEALLRTYRDITPETFDLKIEEFGADSVNLPEWCATTARTRHTPESLALRIDSDHGSLVYSGDVADEGAIVALCKDADILLCECSFPDGHGVADHLAPSQVGRLASSSAVQRVVLTHLYPPAIEADVVSQVQAHFSGSVVKAYDGMTIEI